MLDIKTARAIHLALFNAAVVIALLGAVILIANNLEHIPGTVFVGVFSALALWLGVTGIREVRHDAAVAQIWCFWSGIAYGIAVFSGAHLFGLVEFIPDLLLLWTIGLLLLAYLCVSVLQMAAVTALSMAWLFLAFLYSQPYLPGAIILGVTYWFALRRRQSSGLFVLAVLGTLLLANLYFYDLSRPAHYPLVFSIAQLVLTLALFAALSGASSLVVQRAAPQSRWLGYAHAVGSVANVVGVAVLLGLSSRSAWADLTATFDGDMRGFPIGFLIGLAILLVVAIPVFTRPIALGARTTFLVWVSGWLLLAAGLADQPSGLRAAVPLIAALLAFGVAGGLLVGGLRRPRLAQLVAGVVVLALVALALATEWSTYYLSSALIAFGAASVVFVVADRYRRGAKPIRDLPSVDLLGLKSGGPSQGV
jgi:hypothetical protein